MNIPACLVACTLLAPCVFADALQEILQKDVVEKKLLEQIATATGAYDKRQAEIKAQKEALDAAYQKKLAEINQARIANLERLRGRR